MEVSNNELLKDSHILRVISIRGRYFLGDYRHLVTLRSLNNVVMFQIFEN